MSFIFLIFLLEIFSGVKSDIAAAIISMDASLVDEITAFSIDLAVSTLISSTPMGGSISEAVINTTSAPLSIAASAIKCPIFPEDLLVIYLTGSIG